MTFLFTSLKKSNPRITVTLTQIRGTLQPIIDLFFTGSWFFVSRSLRIITSNICRMIHNREDRFPANSSRSRVYLNRSLQRRQVKCPRFVIVLHRFLQSLSLLTGCELANRGERANDKDLVIFRGLHSLRFDSLPCRTTARPICLICPNLWSCPLFLVPSPFPSHLLSLSAVLTFSSSTAGNSTFSTWTAAEFFRIFSHPFSVHVFFV